MQPRRRRSRPAVLLIVAAALAVVVAACSGTGGTAQPTSAAPASPGGSAAPSSAPVPLTVGLGYIPSVQFAQFYLAQQEGYYRAAGLDVTFQNKIDPDLVTLIGTGTVDIGLSDGTSVIPAGSQGVPVRYGATIYAQNPNVVVTKASSGIKSAADLKGRKLGIPGKYGSSWIMLQALLKGAGLTPDDVQLVLYPDFGQAVALQQGVVDAATGFANNEPIQLEKGGIATTLLTPDAATPMPGPGLIAATKTIQAKGAALRAFTAATLKAMKEIQADPNRGVDAAIAVVPALGSDRATQLKILVATAALWESDYTKANGLGAVDSAAWDKAVAFMTSLGLVAAPVTAAQLVTPALLAP